MTELIMLVGLPGSGKSTLAKELHEIRGYPVVSSDAIRKEVLGSEADQSNNELVFDTLHKHVRNLTHYGYSVIVDATNVRREHRKAILDSAPEADAKLCVVMDTPLKDCLKRNDARAAFRKVPEEVIVKMEQSLKSEPVTLLEGFDMVMTSSSLAGLWDDLT